MYQAFQNILHGCGTIMGASLGGVISDIIGWRFCFLMQVPVSVSAFLIARWVIKPPPKREPLDEIDEQPEKKSTWEQIDSTGACLLFISLALQLGAMSMGSNGYSWTHPAILGSLIASCGLLAWFAFVESTTTAVPLMPLVMLKSVERVALLLINICLGMSGYGVSDCRFPRSQPFLINVGGK